MENDNEITSKFSGLPMADLIAEPLTAVCDSQLKLAKAQYRYMMKIGFNDDRSRVRFKSSC